MVGGVFAFVAAYQLGMPTQNAAIFVLGAALFLLVVVIAVRIRTLRRLCATGVEVEAELEDVSPTGMATAGHMSLDTATCSRAGHSRCESAEYSVGGRLASVSGRSSSSIPSILTSP